MGTPIENRGVRDMRSFAELLLFFPLFAGISGNATLTKGEREKIPSASGIAFRYNVLKGDFRQWEQLLRIAD
jgi:hypothetical protein